jgi:hypothetical protein
MEQFLPFLMQCIHLDEKIRKVQLDWKSFAL